MLAEPGRSTLLVATRNPGKIRELERILGGRGLRIVTPVDLGIGPSAAEDDVEAAPTFIGNALAKARYFAGRCGLPTLAEDSGLVVPRLGGGPGVRSRRFALDAGSTPPDTIGEELDIANNRLLLERLAGSPDDARHAWYVCAAALVQGDPNRIAIGTLEGRIGFEERGSGGFGYDSLFIPLGMVRTAAELSPDEKSRISHRARALRALGTVRDR